MHVKHVARWQNQLSGKPTVSIGFLTRLQADLIDISSVSYDGYNLIMHVLPSKETIHVAKNLRNIFYTHEPPKILQNDNGKEFV